MKTNYVYEIVKPIDNFFMRLLSDDRIKARYTTNLMVYAAVYNDVPRPSWFEDIHRDFLDVQKEVLEQLNL